MLKVTPEVNYTTKKKSNDTTDNLTKTSRVTSHSNSELLSRAKDLTEGNKITIIAGNFIDETQRINDSNKLKQESKSSVDTISKSDIKINILKQYRTQTDKYIEHEEKPQLNHFNHCRFILKNILGDKKLKNYQEKTSLSFFMKIKKERKNDINSLLFKFFSLFKSYNIQNETIITNNFSIIRNFKDDDKFSDDKINEDKSKDKNDQTPLFDLNLKKAMNENILNYYNPIREHSKIDEKIAEKLVNVDRFKKFRKNIIYNGEILDEDLNLDLCKEIEEDIRKIVKDILDQNFKENRYNEQKKTFQISQKKLKKLAKLEKKSKLLNESHIYLYICEYISEKFNTFFDATYQKTDEFWNCTDEIFLRLGNKQKLIWKDINKIVDKNIQKEKAWSEHYLKKLIINLKKYGDPNNSRYFANISSSFAAEESLEILFMKFRELKIDEITEKIIPEISSSCSDEYLTTLIETNNNIVILYSLYKLMLDEEEKSSLENDFLYYCYYYNYSKKKYFEFQNLHLQEIKSWDQKKKEDKNDKEETEDIAEQNKDGFVKNENNSGEEEKKTKVIINEADQKKQRKELLEGTRKLFQHMSNGMQEYKLKMSKLIKDFQELVEKIFDGDLNCLIFCRKPDFQDCKHFLNLHPMIAGIIGFYDKLKTYKKERDCFYTDEKLPKITFINFDGYDDRSNYYFARNLAKNLQIISIVFDGEKDIIEAIDHTVDDIEKIRHKKHFYFIPFREATQLEENQEKLNQKEKKIHEASEKETKQEESKTKEKKKYEINSKCLLKLFEKIVFKLIEKYSPSAIVLSHSFCFSNTINENGLSLSPKTFSKIIRKLCLLSNYKLIIFPNISFKSENISPDEKYNNWKNKFSFENNNSLNDNRKYIYEMLGATISAINQNQEIFGKHNKIEESSLSYLTKNPEFDEEINRIINKRLKNGLTSNLCSKFGSHKINQKLINKISRNVQNNFRTNSIDIDETKTKITIEKNSKEISQKDINNCENGCFLSNKLPIYNKEINKLIIYELKYSKELPEDLEEIKERNFYFNDKAIYYVHYSLKKIFFFNICYSSQDINNYFFDFTDSGNLQDSQNYLFAKPMTFYYEKENSLNKHKQKFLTDFSICATQNKIYLFWGILNQRGKENFNKIKEQKISNDILMYSILEDKWTKLIQKNHESPLTKLGVASIAFEKSKDLDVIYVLGGYGISKEYDIYNNIDVFEVEKNSKSPQFTYIGISKSENRDFKPLYNSLTVELPKLKSKNQDKDIFILIGGTFSPYVYSQSQRIMSAYIVKITKKNEDDYSVNFDGCLKKPPGKNDIYNDMKGLNLILGSKSRNIYSNHLTDSSHLNEIVFCPSIFSNEKNGFFLDMNSKKLTHTFILDSEGKILNKHLISHDFFKNQTIFAFSVPILNNQADFSKFSMQDKIQVINKFNYYAIKQFVSSLNRNEIDFILVSEDRSGLVLLNFKRKSKNDQKYVPEDFTISYLEFTVPDLKKPNYPYKDYLPSNTTITNYCKCDDKIYVLVNNRHDNKFKRSIYELNLSAIDPKYNVRPELNKIFENEFQVKGSTLIAESSSKFYLVGGYSQEERNKYNLSKLKNEDEPLKNPNGMIDLFEKKSYSELPNNKITMISPFVFLWKEYIFCINRFYQKNTNFPYVYGEFISSKNDKEWIDFKIDVISGKVLKKEKPNGIFNDKTYFGDVIICKIVSLGRLNEIEDFSSVETLFIEYFDLKSDKPNNLKKKFLFLNIDKLVKFFYEYEERCIELHEELKYELDGEDCYYRIRDFSEGDIDENKILFFTSSLNINICRNYYEKSKKQGI